MPSFYVYHTQFLDGKYTYLMVKIIAHYSFNGNVAFAVVSAFIMRKKSYISNYRNI